MNLYVRYQDQEDIYIICNRRFSKRKLEELLWTRTNLTEEQIEEILQEGMILEKETFELQTVGRAIITTERKSIITLVGDRKRVIFYPDASFEEVELFRDKVEDWFLETVKKVKDFFLA